MAVAEEAQLASCSRVVDRFAYTLAGVGSA